MGTRILRTSTLLACGFAAAVGSLSSPAGSLEQSDGTVIPVRRNQDGCGDGDLQSCIDDSEGERTIDLVEMAATVPETFNPLCTLTFHVLARGAAFDDAFGWYNVDPNGGPPPGEFDGGLYEFIHCDDNPGGDPIVFNIRDDPRYAGGLIGFFMASPENEDNLGGGSAKGDNCPQFDDNGVAVGDTVGFVYYSERQYNPDVVAEPAVHLLTYNSVNISSSFYFAWEDLLAPDGNTENCDNDFDDLLTLVEGINCVGGGQPCLTTSEGACGFGLTECLPDGTIACVPQLEPGPEACDNIDNDCNGLVDDGDLCPPGEICDRGVCKPPCSGGEFPCPGDMVCDATSGACMDPLCVGVECDPGSACHGGECLGGCDDVVCPWGQICQLGRCVDPCASRQPGMPNACPDGYVCEGGVCLEFCGCRPCLGDLECSVTTGACVPAGCDGVTCPDNEVCLAGIGCANACTNVICPGGAACDPATGLCGDPIPGQTPSTAPEDLETLPDGGVVVPLEDGGVPLLQIDPNADKSEPAPGLGGTGEQAACGCRMPGGRTGAGVGACLLLLVPLLRRRRRDSAGRRRS